MNSKLTLKQRRFCDYYLEGDGNATDAVIKAGYNVSKKNGMPNRLVARNIASENLAKPGISRYIRDRLASVGLDDDNVLIQHAMLVNQFANLPVKLKAIDMYYKISGKYSQVRSQKYQSINIIEVTNYSLKQSA